MEEKTTSRRNFLKTSAALSAVPLLAGSWSRAMGANDRIRVESLKITCGTEGPQTAELRLKVDGETRTTTANGDGPVDATFRAIRELFPHEARLQLYQVHAVTGGTEACLTHGTIRGWEAMRVISPDTCRPFSKDRKGMILGEGGAMMILEPFDAARARGAKIYAEICGFGMTSDAHHLTQPTVTGPARAMRGALREAGLAPEAIGYINAHGTGTPGNDPVESRAIREVFGAHADKIGVSSTKSLHGHALGAAGALEAVATVLALYHGILPPTANFTESDPECDLDYIPNQPRAVQVEAALSNSFAFGGLNAVVSFRTVR